VHVFPEVEVVVSDRELVVSHREVVLSRCEVVLSKRHDVHAEDEVVVSDWSRAIAHCVLVVSHHGLVLSHSSLAFAGEDVANADRAIVVSGFAGVLSRGGQAMPVTSPRIVLRPLESTDLPVFFEHQRDPVAIHMVAFSSRDPADRAAFDAHWARTMTLPSVVHRTILVDDAVAGYVAKFERDGVPEVCYYLGREHWGRGVASRALAMLLDEVPVRPLHAGVAHDNVGSRRVLEKCGFREVERVRGFAQARGEEIEEVHYELR
jgi:RimJ/RimL family protein N-acetyltransferase